MLSFVPRFFSESEFNKLTPSCSLQDMDDDFMSRLENARHLAGIPFRLSCAYRSRQWDLAKNRSGSSYHCFGRAVDILCNNDRNRGIIVQALLRSGLKGIGIAKTFIHCDNRSCLTIWLYI